MHDANLDRCTDLKSGLILPAAFVLYPRHRSPSTDRIIFKLAHVIALVDLKVSFLADYILIQLSPDLLLLSAIVTSRVGCCGELALGGANTLGQRLVKSCYPVVRCFVN